jgi:hypothetical protein
MRGDRISPPRISASECEPGGQMSSKQPKLGYAYEKLCEVVNKLAIGEGDVRLRLYDTYHILSRVSPSALPLELQKDMSWIYEQLTKYKPDYEWQTPLTVTLFSKIRNRTGSRIAQKIVELKYRLEGYLRSAGNISDVFSSGKNA